MTGADDAATMAATFADEWVRAGITDVVLAPGSRSTPLTLALLADDRLRAHTHIDERSAGFMALGIAAACGTPAPVVTTSGTAAVEVHPAVVEAHHSALPMIVCTADRPPELRGIGSPQTIDQRELFGRCVRLALDLDPPDESTRVQWRSWAAQTVLAAMGDPPGPVHCNLGFREPLVGTCRPLPPGRSDTEPWHRRAEVLEDPDLRDLEGLVARATCGVIVAGRGCGGAPSIVELGARLGWPVLADALSGLRGGGDGVVAAFDPLLRDARFAGEQVLDVVVQFGSAPASKALMAWLEQHGAQRAVVGRGPELPRPGRDASVVTRGDPAVVASSLLRVPLRRAGEHWRDRWTDADRAAQEALDRELGERLTEPAVARAVVDEAPAGGCLVVSSSMPVRDVEWFGPNSSGAAVLANRGANGIDGVVSTAVGVALTGRPTVALLGDLAFLHDSNGLMGARGSGIDLTIVVVDNDGGGIFSFLPQAEEVPPAAFEAVFGTPHGLDLVAVAQAYGIKADRVTTLAGLRAATPADGVRVVVVPSDRAANVAEHERLHVAVRRHVAHRRGVT